MDIITCIFLNKSIRCKYKVLRTHMKATILLFLNHYSNNSWSLRAAKRTSEQKAVLSPTEQDNICTQKRHSTQLLELQ